MPRETGRNQERDRTATGRTAHNHSAAGADHEHAFVMRAEHPISPAVLTPPDSVPALAADHGYLSALSRIVYYWAYPLIDVFCRTTRWEETKKEGVKSGFFVISPLNQLVYLADYLPRAQRWVNSPNNDTLYGSCFTDLGQEPLVLQTPDNVPDRHYWTVQMGDAFTNVVHQLGSATGTPGGKYLVLGPAWQGEPGDDYLGVLRMPTNLTWIVARSFMAQTPESRSDALNVLGQIGAYPLSEDKPGLRVWDPISRPESAQAIQGDHAPGQPGQPPQPVVPATFWPTLEKALDMNPQVGASDLAMAEQARTLLAAYASDRVARDLMSRVVQEADHELRMFARYERVGIDAGNGWRRQTSAGLWGSDWFGRAQATVIYVMVNDFREAMYFIRATDHERRLLNGRFTYTITFPPNALPPVDRERGGFWSLTLYNDQYFMLADPPNGRTNIGTVNLDANQLSFDADGSITIHIAREEPSEPAANANWLPAPADNFALIVRTYVPMEALLEREYELPDVVRVTQG